jgi:hypothetical protein
VDKPEGPNIQIRSIADGVVHPDYHPTSASDAAFCDAAKETDRETDIERVSKRQ